MIRKSGQQIQERLLKEFKRLGAAGLEEPQRKQIRALLTLYYQHVPPAELENENTTDLVGAVVAHWQLLQRHRAGKPAIRVYNPNFEEHGWQSPHTIIEVVNEDLAFLVDSLSMVLNQAGLTIQLTVHPVIRVERGDSGQPVAIHPAASDLGSPVSIIQFQVDKQLDPEMLASLEKMVRRVLSDVIRANQYWEAMRARMIAVRDRSQQLERLMDADELAEANAFMDWMVNGNFTFLGYCELDLVSSGGKEALRIDSDSVLGIYEEGGDEAHALERIVPLLGDRYADLPCHLLVTKADARSTVHRPAYLDFVAVKRYDAKGNGNGVHCVIGLFTRAAYSSAPRYIPLLRKKVMEVITQVGLPPFSHSGKVLFNILDNFPRDALFQVPTDELFDITMGILSLQERQRTKLFAFKDHFNRFYSFLVYLPRERYNRDLRLRMQKVLVSAVNGAEVEVSTLFTESILARIHYIVHTPQDGDIRFDLGELEQRIRDATLGWRDILRIALSEQYGEAKASRFYRDYRNAFPGGFREDVDPRAASLDIPRIEEARVSGRLGLHFYRPILEASDRIHVRLYSPGKPVPLSEAIPILEHMGLSVFGESPYRLRLRDGEVWIHDFSMRHARGPEHLTGEAGERFRQAFLKVWSGEADNDGFNQLVMDADLTWREAVLIRAYSQYLKQVKIPYSQAYIIESLTQNATITRHLVQLFALRFTPDRKRSPQGYQRLLEKIEHDLEAVRSLDQDRILRAFVNLVQSTLRTNYFQYDAGGAPKPYISFKIDPHRLENIPLPLPMFEIFVFSPRMEAVHLRGGRVARGGLRWSDRREDYRTEVLGLMKAQMVKNTVIVPVGSKGGFIVKRLASITDRERVMEEVIACYRTFLRGMLDLTDNLDKDTVVPPPRVVRYDPDDPYLVIAADKGTATFSDIANEVAGEYGFWLGDAFASGGSKGYDHKKMGITAKGAWESVKRNFRELNMDIQTTPFRVIGIGDMSGDVFGNGMLLSRQIKLVGAFNHLHIFLDPNPDLEASFQERERLFKLPRSGWNDYRRELISPGGGVYERSAKSIQPSDEAKALLGIKSDRLTPNELIQHILRAPVDLLWNGGIGTYVKAESESNADVGDKANDGVRINGAELRCRVIGEGGNLGLTQLGRVEYAAKGGLIYTDFIDNSGGVDCSDHEVNIKVLLGQALAHGDMTQKQRDNLLIEMTDDITELVLADNYAQSQAISMVQSTAAERLYEHARFIEFLEQKGALNRKLEFLPSKQQIASRQAAGQGLTKPEVAVLLSYSKMNYYQALIDSDIPDDEYLRPVIFEYFPHVLGERFRTEIGAHRLRREIIATCLTNKIVNHIGPGFGFKVKEEIGANIGGVTRAYMAASRTFDTDRLWQEIEALDNQVPAGIQIEMMRLVTALLERSVTWILRYRQNNLVIRDIVDFFRDGVVEISEHISKPLAAQDRLEFNRRARYFANNGVPRSLAERVSATVPLGFALDIVEVSQKHPGRGAPAVASIYFNLGKVLDFHWIRQQIGRLNVQSHWHGLANARLIETLNAHQRTLTAQIIETAHWNRYPMRMIDQWADANRAAFDSHQQVLADFKGRSAIDFAMLSVLVTGVGNLLLKTPQRAG